MMTRISIQELESYLWGAATLLRGTIDAGDYKQFIFPLLFYKRLCDVYDEETQSALRESGGDTDFAAFPENHRFQIPPEAHWRVIRQVARDVGQSLQSAMRSIETANPDKLFGIFGDAQWTNKDRLSDAMLRDLIEHFSTLELTLSNLPEDELGNGYEYLIKKFADDSGHTAAEFYTNRTVVHLMTELLQPQPGESIYDPTCGSGGMLISCIAQLRRQGKEWRNVHLFGQERNLMTSSIARMNCFLHGIEDFRIERGDTLSEPKFIQGDRLQQFDLVLANPPYSIKQWDRTAFANDPWGRKLYGTPPQGRADYAFWQHILCSLKPDSGRCAILFPHGVLFRQEEAEMREKIIKADVIECVIGLGPNLFYNSPMEACIVVCRMNKSLERKGKILFINAVNEVTRENAQSFLTNEHIEHISSIYQNYLKEPEFSMVINTGAIQNQKWNLSISLYVSKEESIEGSNSHNIDGLMIEPLSTWLNSLPELRNKLSLIVGRQSADLDIAGLNINNKLPPWLKRKEWKRIQFGDFANSINERVEPADASKEIYVGLEHLVPGNLHIKRSGKGSDVIGTKLRFRKGDIIFGRRRAYQRKLAVAEIDGICSAHAMVVRAKPDVVLPEFLPFFMISDEFMNRAVEISVGSLSPTINWTTLRIQKFDLPPLDQQKRIAEIMWILDDCLQAWENAEGNAADLLSLLSNKYFSLQRKDIENSWPLYSLGEACSLIRDGTHLPPARTKEGPLLLGVTNIIDGKLQTTESDTRIPDDFYKNMHKSWQLVSGDVLLAIVGATIGKTAFVPDNFPKFTIQRSVAVLRGKTRFLDNRFLRHFLDSSIGQQKIWARVNQTAQPGIYLGEISKITIPIPPLAEQERICEELNRINIFRNQVLKHRKYLDEIIKKLTNSIWLIGVRLCSMKQIPSNK